MSKQKNDKKKLSIEDFKASANVSNTKEALSKIVGGVLSTCHTVNASAANG
ncbi:MAG: hypothetical protein WCF67_08890 [Chitinophagaceae bacterium]